MPHVAQVRPGEIYAVYDLGGGTFDFALLRKEEEGFTQVGEAAGLERLGGIDFDEAVFRYVIDRLPADVVQSIRTDPDAGRALGQLRRACVETKEGLSSEVAVDIPVVLPGLSTTVRLDSRRVRGHDPPSLDQSIELVRRTLDRAEVRRFGHLWDPARRRFVTDPEGGRARAGGARHRDADRRPPKARRRRGAARWSASAAPRATDDPIRRWRATAAETWAGADRRSSAGRRALRGRGRVRGVRRRQSPESSASDPSSPATLPQATSPGTSSPTSSAASSSTSTSTNSVPIPSEPLSVTPRRSGPWRGHGQRQLASGGKDRRCGCGTHDRPPDRRIGVRSHRSRLRNGVVSRRSKLASGGNDQTVCVWDSTTGDDRQISKRARVLRPGVVTRTAPRSSPPRGTRCRCGTPPTARHRPAVRGPHKLSRRACRGRLTGARSRAAAKTRPCDRVERRHRSPSRRHVRWATPGACTASCGRPMEQNRQ